MGEYLSKSTQIPSSVFVLVCQRDLRVHSVSGVLRLMWMLSIQMCPLVPCTKKPSITTYRRQTGGGEEKREEEDEANEDRGQDRGEEEEKKDN